MFRDLFERAVRTFVPAFIAALAIAVPITDLSTGRAAVMSAFAAGISAVISLLAATFGVRGSASLDPANAGTVRAEHRQD